MPALRADHVIKEVKSGDPALPPELLVSRLRQQLADQLQVTYQQEQKAQTQRIETEKARATAEQQHQLVWSTPLPRKLSRRSSSRRTGCAI